MSTRFHINPKTGDVGRCRATRDCPFGDLDRDHYSSTDEARQVLEQNNLTFSDSQITKKSKKLAYILRHSPESVGIKLDSKGNANVDELISVLNCSKELLQTIVDRDDKNRYEMTGEKIRARQGHSISVILDIAASPPPPVLFHGTSLKSLDAILQAGLKPMDRHHVHLSPDLSTATQVGSRRGKAVILEIDSDKMAKAGINFFKTGNNVWLVDYVAPEFIKTI